MRKRTSLKKAMLRLHQIAKKILLLCFFAILALSIWLYYYATTPLNFIAANQSFVIEYGQTTNQITTFLEEKDLIKDRFWFLILARLMRVTHKIKAGSYELQSPCSAYQLLKKITDGDVRSATMTIIEGWNWQNIRHALAQNPYLRHDTQHMSDEEIGSALGITNSYIEGLFFPDTYHYVKGSSDLAILKRAYILMQKNLAQAWAARAADLPVSSAYELLILASLIEKETGQAADREIISGVFNNRLRIRMRLQTDPSVIYGMGAQYTGKLRKSDLLKDNKYNTYTRTGLPPSPISVPGRASLFAAAQPAKTKALYFVAKKDGSSYFSETLLEHNRAIMTYLKENRR